MIINKSEIHPDLPDLTTKHQLLDLHVFRSLSIFIAGVGGHGGSGIHADLESKYQEIIQRVSMYAIPSPQETVQLSPRLEISRKTDTVSVQSLPSFMFPVPSPATDTLVIPGYGGGGGSNPSGSLRQIPGDRGSGVGVGGSGGVAGGASGAGTEQGGGLRNTAASPTGSPPRGQVEQVHVTKCAVCTIL